MAITLFYTDINVLLAEEFSPFDAFYWPGTVVKRGLCCHITSVVHLSFLSVTLVSHGSRYRNTLKYKHKYNSYFYCAPYSLTDGALQKSANTCFTAVGRLK